MTTRLTQEEFSKHLNTKFRIDLDGGDNVEFELVEVKGYMGGDQEQTGMERFSIFFQGPSEPYLLQSTYSLQHDRMGKFEIFLVPIGRSEPGVQYEAVFNYFRDQSR